MVARKQREMNKSRWLRDRVKKTDLVDCRGGWLGDVKEKDFELCRDPASAGSRGTLRMNSISKRERPDWGCAAESGHALFFTIAFIF